MLAAPGPGAHPPAPVARGLTAHEVHELADYLLARCTRDETTMRNAMVWAAHDRYALWYLRPRLFAVIADSHGEVVAGRRLRHFDAWLGSRGFAVLVKQ